MSGSHSHGAGSSGAHSHGGGRSGAHSHGDSSIGGFGDSIALIAIVAAICYAIFGAWHLGKFLYESLHKGFGPQAAGSWGSMYLNMGWGVVWAAVSVIVLLGLLISPSFRRRAPIVILVGIVAVALAIIFGGAVAVHFGDKIGTQPW